MVLHLSLHVIETHLGFASLFVEVAELFELPSLLLLLERRPHYFLFVDEKLFFTDDFLLSELRVFLHFFLLKNQRLLLNLVGLSEFLLNNHSLLYVLQVQIF